MDALATRIDGATERPTVELHDQLCLKARQESSGTKPPRPELSICRHGQASTGLSDEPVVHSTVDNELESGTAWTYGARYSRSNRTGNHLPARGMNGDRASRREDSGLCRSPADQR
jgi:hypothetical protein